MQPTDSDSYVKALVEKRSAQLPDDVRQMLIAVEPIKALQWLDANDDGKAIIASRAAAAADPVSQLTPAELDMARKSNMTPEQWVAAKTRATDQGWK